MESSSSAGPTAPPAGSQPPTPAPAPLAPAPDSGAVPPVVSDSHPGLFRGRIGRLGYLAFLGYVVGFFVVFALVIALLTAVTPAGSGARTAANIVAFGFGPIFLIGCTVFGISVSIRRWHDLGQSGWFILLNLVPVVSFVVGILMFVLPGAPGPNKYGEPFAGAGSPGKVLGLK